MWIIHGTLLVTQWNLLYFSDFNPAEEVKGQGIDSTQPELVSVAKIPTAALCPGARSQHCFGSSQEHSVLSSVVSMVMKTAPVPPLCVFSELLILIRVTQLEVIQSSPALQP